MQNEMTQVTMGSRSLSRSNTQLAYSFVIVFKFELRTKYLLHFGRSRMNGDVHVRFWSSRSAK